MGAQFFVGWQTWEMLSFVLGCAIVLVFAFGLARLWYTNRKIERLELIDEERRVRLAEMRHCGIPTRSDNDIPFGVRAIQSGIEVEGIWISRTNTPEASKRASVATLVADSGDSTNKGKGKARAVPVDTSFEEPRRLHSMTFAGSSTDQVINSSPLARSMAVTNEYHPHQVAVAAAADELDPFVVANTRPSASSRPTSTISAITGAEPYYDITGSIGRPYQPAELSSHARHDSWEADAHISQQYDGSSYDGATQGRNASGYAKLQMQQPYMR